MFTLFNRSGTVVPLRLDKITDRLQNLCKGLSIDPCVVTQGVASKIEKNMHTYQVDDLVADYCNALSSHHPDFGVLAGRLRISNLHKETSNSFYECMKKCYECHSPSKEHRPLITLPILQFIEKNKEAIEKAIDHTRDYIYNEFAICTLERSYLHRLNGKIVERPQYMLMRVACCVWCGDLTEVIHTYNTLHVYFTVATPTLYNAARPNGGLASCFLLQTEDDSIDGIYSTLKKCALISKEAGGIGLAISNIRPTGSYIGGTAGFSNGIIPMLKVFESTAKYVDQCFAQHTKVLTYPNTYRNICDIKVGELVFTHEGRFKMVSATRVYNASGQDMYKVTVGKNTAYVTGSHPLLCTNVPRERPEHMPEADWLRHEIKYKRLDADWTDVKQLVPGQYVATDLKKLCFERVDGVESCEKYPDNQLLYDLEVCDDHSYLTEIGLAHNGGGKRKGSFNIYLEPWHKDIEEFIDLRRPGGDQERRAPALFHAIWVNDLFMIRVQKDEMWTLFDPKTAPGLVDSYGEKFNQLYEKYEKEGKGVKQIRARQLYLQTIAVRKETGQPSILFKDIANRTSNHNHLGTLKTSNLCTEIVEFVAPDEVAVCNLASISLPAFINPDGTYNLEKLVEISKLVTRVLDKEIDITHYPIPEAKKSNELHRPIGIGVQGLADTFARLKMPFGGSASRKLNKDIFEAIYYGSLFASCELAKVHGHYPSYPGSMISKGKLQFDLTPGVKLSGRWPWDELRANIAKYGVRQSLRTALMPTASTSQILGNNEMMEPFTSNLYVRRTLAGEFVCINPHLIRDLTELKMWSPKIKDMIIASEGSVQDIEEIPQRIRDIYRTVWEIPSQTIIDMAMDRRPFIDQSQSLNFFKEDVTEQDVTSWDFSTWKKGEGLMTGMYYLRTQAASEAQKVTIDPVVEQKMKERKEQRLRNKRMLKLDLDEEPCLSCTS